MRFRETAKIQTVLAGGKISFRRDTGYRITLPNGVVKKFKPKALKALTEVEFITNVLELDPNTVTLLETEDRKTPPRFAPKSKERAADAKARRDRIRKRKARQAQRNTLEITLATTDAQGNRSETTNARTQRIVAEMASEMGVTLVNPVNVTGGESA